MEATTHIPRVRVPEAQAEFDTTAWEGQEGSPGGAVEPPVANVEYSQQEGEAARAWVCCDPFDPVPIGPKPTIVFGRSRWCDMILPHDSVSRNHAVIRVAGDKILVEDRSTYGTYLNGERVRSAEVRVDDVITLGPYELTVRRTKFAPNKDEANTTKPFRTLASSEAMQGRLERIPLAEVLQQIEFHKKSGTLRVFHGDFDGKLIFYEGRPMYATAGELADDEVVFAMLALPKGNFSFMSQVEPGEMSMDTTITSLLLEASRRADEAG